MKKILFNDKLGLTQAVLDGRKTQTRRIVPQSVIDRYDEWRSDAECIAMPQGSTIESLKDWLSRKEIRYNVGEIVAVAQSYSSIVDELEDCNNATCAGHYEENVGKAAEYILRMEHPGFNNKLFVSADKMIHHIRITNMRIERLQDISDKDCLKEGIKKEWDIYDEKYIYVFPIPNLNSEYVHDNPREAFAHLIDKVAGKGTWNSNPYVWVYNFELV